MTEWLLAGLRRPLKGLARTSGSSAGEKGLEPASHLGRLDRGPAEIVHGAGGDAGVDEGGAGMGEGALERLDADAATRMPEFNREAKRLYDQFMTIARA